MLDEQVCSYCGANNQRDEEHTDQCEWQRFTQTLLRFSPRRERELEKSS